MNPIIVICGLAIAAIIGYAIYEYLNNPANLPGANTPGGADSINQNLGFVLSAPIQGYSTIHYITGPPDKTVAGYPMSYDIGTAGVTLLQSYLAGTAGGTAYAQLQSYGRQFSPALPQVPQTAAQSNTSNSIPAELGNTFGLITSLL